MRDQKIFMKDLWGETIYDHYFDGSDKVLETKTNISESEILNVSYLFRNFEQMPELEKIALSESKGTVLDIGCGAGSHSLYLQNERGMNVTAIDLSEKAVEVCKLRGLENAVCENIFDYQPTEKFSTILLLMNGTGICGKLENLESFLLKLKSLLTPLGQILVESSDLESMYSKNALSRLQKNGKYFGELRFSMSYQNNHSPDFDWLYVDCDLLVDFCEKVGLGCENIFEGDDDEFLARLTIKKV